MTNQNVTVEDKFQAYLSAKMPNARDVTITNFARMTEGFSYETYLADVRWLEDGEVLSQGFAVRMVPEAGVVEPYDKPITKL